MWSITNHYTFNTFSWNLATPYSLDDTIPDTQTHLLSPGREHSTWSTHNITPTTTRGPVPVMVHTDLLSTEICTSFTEKGHQILSSQIVPYLQYVVICLYKLVTLDDYSRTLFRLICKIHFKCSANMSSLSFWFTCFSSNLINFILQKISFYLCRDKKVFILSYNEIIFSPKTCSVRAFSPQKL